jgi:hypothetical protein
MSHWENHSCYTRICQVSRLSNIGQTSSNSRIYIITAVGVVKAYQHIFTETNLPAVGTKVGLLHASSSEGSTFVSCTYLQQLLFN